MGHYLTSTSNAAGSPGSAPYLGRRDSAQREISEAELARQLARVGLARDAGHALSQLAPALVAGVYGLQQEPLRDLASMVGGALALGRLHAVRSENPLLADLLDESRVSPGDGSFQVEMALPLVTLADHLGECARHPRANALAPCSPCWKPATAAFRSK